MSNRFTRAEALYKRITDDESLEEMVSNPFFLQALAYINTSNDEQTTIQRIPLTRSELIRVFAETLIDREVRKQESYLTNIHGGMETLSRFLSELGFSLQQRREGGTSIRTEALTDIWNRYPDWPGLLWIARRARLLGKRGETVDELANKTPNLKQPERIEFVHHRLQEYFAASELAQRFMDGESMERYLEDIWWQETVIIAIGLVSDARIALANILSPRPNVNAWIKCVVDQASKEMPPEEIGETKGDNKTV